MQTFPWEYWYCKYSGTLVCKHKAFRKPRKTPLFTVYTVYAPHFIDAHATIHTSIGITTIKDAGNHETRVTTTGTLRIKSLALLAFSLCMHDRQGQNKVGFLFFAPLIILHLRSYVQYYKGYGDARRPSIRAKMK